MRTTFLALLATASLVAAGCSSQSPATSENATAQPAAQAPGAAPGATPAAAPSQPGAQAPQAAAAASQAAAAAPATAGPTTQPAAPAPAPPAAPAEPAPPPPPTYKDVTLPAGATVPVKLVSSLASDTSKVEDPVHAEVRHNIEREGLVVIPAGAKVAGVVTGAEQSGRVKGVAQLSFRFSSVTVDDERYDVAAAPIAMSAQSTKKKDAGKVGIGTGAGAIIGAIAGGGKGAAIGAGVGAAAGTGVVMATRGEEVRLPAGTPVTMTLSGPLTIRVLLPR
jgi:hypothetical protein